MVRSAEIDDAEAIARVHVSTWQAGYAELLPREFLEQLSVADRAEIWRGRLRRPGPQAVWVAEKGGEVIGFVSFGPSRDEDGREASEIYALYVAPDHWRTGAGRALMEQAERALPRGRLITLWVLQENPRANAFYRSRGFLPDGGTKEVAFGATRLAEVRLRKYAGR